MHLVEAADRGVVAEHHLAPELGRHAADDLLPSSFEAAVVRSMVGRSFGEELTEDHDPGVAPPGAAVGEVVQASAVDQLLPPGVVEDPPEAKGGELVSVPDGELAREPEHEALGANDGDASVDRGVQRGIHDRGRVDPGQAGGADPRASPSDVRWPGTEPAEPPPVPRRSAPEDGTVTGVEHGEEELLAEVGDAGSVAQHARGDGFDVPVADDPPHLRLRAASSEL